MYVFYYGYLFVMLARSSDSVKGPMNFCIRISCFFVVCGVPFLFYVTLLEFVLILSLTDAS